MSIQESLAEMFARVEAEQDEEHKRTVERHNEIMDMIDRIEVKSAGKEQLHEANLHSKRRIGDSEYIREQELPVDQDHER